MKKLLLIIFVATTLNLSADSWTQKANLGTTFLRAMRGFSIGDKGYFCGGLDVGGNTTDALWQYDTVTNAWTQKANYGGGTRCALTAFVIQGKAYVGTGFNNRVRRDWWQYDTTTNVWTQKSDFGNARYNSYSFTINNLGYVSGGIDSSSIYHNDLWEYNPVTDVWANKTSCPIIASQAGVSFSLNNKGYIGGGYNPTVSPFTTTFWEYDQTLDSWTQKGNIPTAVFIDNGFFTIGNYGYVVCGDSTGGFFNFLWQYNSVLDQWVQKTSFPGAIRDEVVAFAIGNKGYTGGGGNNGSPVYNDFYEYSPDISQNGVSEIEDLRSATVYPNPFTTFTTITFKEQQQNIIIKITDELGKEIKTETFSGKQLTIDKGKMQAGIYFVNITDGKKNICNKKIIIQ